MSEKITESNGFDHRGAAFPPAGMEDALDEQRAASMADEGGASGMIVEAQTPLARPAPRFPRWAPWVGVGFGVGVGLVVLGYLLARRSA